jgi:hypothetical protein
MGILQALIDALTGWLRPRQGVCRHVKQQAHEPSWSRHRSRWIGAYTRRRPRRAW